jgi:tetratricopeptide (TPR) repeat protein
MRALTRQRTANTILTPPSSPAMLDKTISHYRILAKLGAGGMGVVYRAHDEQLDRDVALKVLSPGTLANDGARRRFKREALALAKLNHPNIESVYEFGSESGTDFLVMELVGGVPLHTRLLAGPMVEKEILRLGSQLADGLDAAHAQGIIHRDLKPGNLHVTKDDRLKILDFGLAQWVQMPDENTLALTMTRSQEITGTLPYMAPEQLRGQRADQRSDIYSAGAVLYEMATGKRPHEQTSGPLLISAILEQPLEPPSTHNRQITPVLEGIILKALDKDPDRRYQSARELYIDLDRLITGTAVTRTGGGGANRKWLWAGIAAAALLVLFALNVDGVRSRLFRGAAPTQTAPAIKARRSVAVLGFKNLSGKPEEAWISTALAEMLSTELAAGEQMRTIPGENVARMKHDLELQDADSFGQDTLQKIRKNLGTDMVVVGSYLAMGDSSGGKLRLDFRLQDAVAGETVAAVSETGTEGELLDLISRSGIELRQKLGIEQVSASEGSDVRASLPSNPEAARLYAEGLAKLRVLDALAARDLLQRAVAADPKNAPSHAALGEAWSKLGYDTKAAAEAKQALDLSANVSREERLFVEARYNELAHQWAKAIEGYRTLVGFFPDNLEYGLRLAASQAAAGEGRDGLDTIEQLKKLPAPAGDDARIDLAESRAAATVSDFKRSQMAAGRALVKGKAQQMQLVVAEARSAQGYALERQGQVSDAAVALGEAQQMFAAAGDQMGAAQALNVLGHVAYDRGDFNGAVKTYQDAFVVFRALGNKRQQAASLNNIGNIHYDKGELRQAKQYYEESVAAYREVDDKAGLAGGLGNLANVLDSMGRLQDSVKMHEAGLAAFREVGDQRGTASTLANLGGVLLEMGDLDGAQARCSEALEIHGRTGYKRGTGYTESALADIFLQRGDMVQARQHSQHAADIRRETGEQLNVALSQLQLGYIAMQEGKAAEAEGLIRAAIPQFEKEKVYDAVGSGKALLSQILMERGQVDDGLKLSDEAVTAAQQTGNKPSRFDAELARGKAVSAAGKSAEATKVLEALLAEAKKFQYLGYEFQARLALGEAEIKARKTAAGRTRLAALQKDAEAKGYLLIARKALKAAS